MNEYANAVKEEGLTFIEESIKKSVQCSEDIATANNKLSEILIRLRGNIPSTLSEDKKIPEPNGNIDRLTRQLNTQSTMLNFLHNQIDELNKYF